MSSRDKMTLMLLLCSDSRNDVPPVPQRNVSIAAEREKNDTEVVYPPFIVSSLSLTAPYPLHPT